MEAKDTVMNDEQILNKRNNANFAKYHHSDCGITSGEYEIAQAQAEISFKEGRHIGRNEGVRVGRREVVEELTRYNRDITLEQLRATNRWQTKAKKWGIDEASKQEAGEGTSQAKEG